MTINMIVAVNKNGIIGNNNSLPWPHNKEDMKWFKTHTLGSSVIMGRKTLESIGKPLKNRYNFVLTRKGEGVPSVIPCRSMDDALINARTHNNKVFIIGGLQIYKLFLPKTDRVYLSIIDDKSLGDTKIEASIKNDRLEIEGEIFSNLVEKKKGKKGVYYIFER